MQHYSLDMCVCHELTKLFWGTSKNVWAIAQNFNFCLIPLAKEMYISLFWVLMLTLYGVTIENTVWKGPLDVVWSNSLLRAGTTLLLQVAQDLFKLNFECFQGWRFHNLSGPLFQGLIALTVYNFFHLGNQNFVCLQIVSVASCCVPLRLTVTSV